MIYTGYKVKARVPKGSNCLTACEVLRICCGLAVSVETNSMNLVGHSCGCWEQLPGISFAKQQLQQVGSISM